jgi:hypothetical protein
MLDVGDQRRFYRFFASLRCQMEVTEMCAPVIAIDAGHMKRAEWAKFVCLVACSLDGNRKNQLLAFAMVPAESIEHYHFFISSMLDTDLGTFIRGDRMLALSDRGKALIAAIRMYLPGTHHRYCYRHLLENFTTELKVGTEARMHYDTIVYSCDRRDFFRSLAFLRAHHPNVLRKLEQIGLEHLAESCMPGDILSHGQHTNNLAEQRMAWLKHDVREHPPVTALVNLFKKLQRS